MSVTLFPTILSLLVSTYNRKASKPSTLSS